jgi:hypothetical protein
LRCGDGTLVDTSTGLMWELKDGTVGNTPNPSDPHDVNALYNWSIDTSPSTFPPNGTLFTQFLATLNDDIDNNNANGCFAGHCDWRIPKEAELLTIVDTNTIDAPGCGSGSPCVCQAAFGATLAYYYWSATTASSNPIRDYGKWFVDFDTGSSSSGLGSNNLNGGRAVRGGR